MDDWHKVNSAMNKQMPNPARHDICSACQDLFPSYKGLSPVRDCKHFITALNF